MNNCDPDILFNENGVCSYCVLYVSQENKRRYEKQKLQWIYHKIRESGKGKKYDVLLGLSGGVDSSTCLHHVVENGIRPLCFSIDNGWNWQEKADENIMRLVEGMKVPFYRYVIDIGRFRDLQAAFIKAGIANLEACTDHVLFAASYELAEKNRIKYIISGGNLSTESILPRSYGYQARDLVHIKGVYKKIARKELSGLPMISIWKYIYSRFVKRIKIINLLDYYEYNRGNAVRLLNEKYGYESYGEKHCENVFTKWFQNYWLPRRFGIDKRRPHYSSLINSGQMTRDEALIEISKPLEYPKIDLLPDIVDGLYIGGDDTHSYKEYPNSEWIWRLLSKTYATFKHRK